MRQKQFDEKEVLFKAVLTFWSQGYKATSLNTLLAEMGIRKQSLYDTFESKHELFMAALKYYHKNVLENNLEPLLTAPSPRKAIEEYFNQRIRDVDDPCIINGCLVTNSLTELGEHHADVQQQTRKSLEYIESVFHRTVKRGQEMGEINSDLDAGHIAMVLLNNAQGLFVVSRSGVSVEKLSIIVSSFLKVLD
ncbi:transcriptional regulator, TetR family [Denitrovibrio acetiphilus DSM 12809]|uniref:Transcriptional regulator, TetR family n=1 Tax=Denitrovibrio acetiphilus (strain DSM 12809 / NBRC 114555 / N2460) TaxID=522772 RepID=D4H2G3_DENA2|nr:TetR/AcrR family transcriptional regulator [Denitrovibrio acetiphilus]ADD68954.1 transcriptional regulator, TetR family [Denitrovibrio acetiphilus DSM 12809]